MRNWCMVCNGSLMSSDGRSYIRDPNAKWWQFWKVILCPACGGDGLQKPPGWPDKKEIDRLRPKPPHAQPSRECGLVLAFAILFLSQIVQAQESDYSLAYRSAQDTKRMLVVGIGVDDPVLATDSNTVYCRLPDGAEHAIEGRTQLLSSHESLRDMEGSGVFVVDFKHEKHFNTVVSLLPKRYCTHRNLKALVELPPGTLTQRTLVWAIRIHPESPESTDCEQAPELMAHAERHSQAQCIAGRQFHNLPTGIATSEIVAESWPENRNIVSAAIDLVASWRQSPGHWNEAAGRHLKFGYDMRLGMNRRIRQMTWFGTGVFYR